MGDTIRDYAAAVLDLLPVGLLFRMALIAAGGQVAIWLGRRIIDRLLFAERLRVMARDSRRTATLRGVLGSMLRFTVHVLVALAILETVGIQTSSLVAGAGIVGLALGFGAQNLIRDVLAGLLIVYEDQFSVGDHVTLAGVDGTVEEMGLRVAKVRDFGGQVHFVPYGIADKVTNHSRGPMRALVDVPVDFDEPPRRVLDALAEACKAVAETSSHVLEPPRVIGITSLDGRRVVYTIVGRSEPTGQWALEREIRQAVNEVFLRVGIKPPDLLVNAIRESLGPNGG